ncbi:hypothetical protein M5689_024473 [Euphorbia peplus]|nr:hypothetical protein M5689_024473 [Euphorbia peplus]
MCESSCAEAEGTAATSGCKKKENAYWSTNMNAYKYEFSGLGSTSYYAPYEVNDNLPSMDVGSATWGYPSVVDVEEPTTADTRSEEDASLLHTSPEERFQIIRAVIALWLLGKMISTWIT